MRAITGAGPLTTPCLGCSHSPVRRAAIPTLLLALSTPALADPPAPRGLFEHPAFVIPLRPGEQSPKGDAKEGMVRVKSAEADQVLYWNLATGPLVARAEHERGLMLRAAKEEGASSTVGDLVERSSPGKRSLSWSARLADTHVRATVVDCGSHHVLLSTLGPSARLVEAQHAASMSGWRCRTAAE